MIDAADFKQYIFPLLFFKRVSDIWDEEYQEALERSDGDIDYARFRENHRFQIPDGCHWSDVRKTSVDIGKKLQNSLREIEKSNFELLHDVFGDAQWTNKRRLSGEKLGTTAISTNYLRLGLNGMRKLVITGMDTFSP